MSRPNIDREALVAQLNEAHQGWQRASSEAAGAKAQLARIKASVIWHPDRRMWTIDEATAAFNYCHNVLPKEPL